jgi:GNAT superfamily N-acetyltransferase
MSAAVTFRDFEQSDAEAASRLVSDVFREAIAPLYSDEGAEEFLSYAASDSIARRVQEGNFILLACIGEEMVALAEIREGSHLALFFVSRARQRNGIGRKLLDRAVAECLAKRPSLEAISVHASPNSLAAYQKLGFVVEGPEQVVQGIRFTPMSLKLSRY